MTKKFLDTSYLLALELAKDQNHLVAKQYWESIIHSPPSFVTTSYVFDEIVTYFNSRGYHTKAVQAGNNLLHSPSTQFVHIDESLFYEGWKYFQQHQDKGYSLTDCISFIVMQKIGIDIALTFDNHFFQAGFQKEP